MAAGARSGSVYETDTARPLGGQVWDRVGHGRGLGSCATAARAAVEAKLAPPSTPTTPEWPRPTANVHRLRSWWADYVLPTEGLAPQFEVWYLDILDRYVIPRIGAHPQRATGAHTRRRRHDDGALMFEGLSHRTAVAARTVTGKVLRAAQSEGWSPAASISPAPHDRGEARAVRPSPRTWSPSCSPPSTARHGVRRRRRWRHRPGRPSCSPFTGPTSTSTPTTRHVSVRRTLTYVGGTALKAPKRPRSYRSVPLAPEPQGALKCVSQAARR